MKKAALIFLVSVLALFMAVPAARAEKAEKNILFILDASGSMQEKIGGQIKIIIAKEILSDLIDELPAEANVGLLVYGNRVQKSCEIVDVTVPVKKLDREALKKALRPIEAKGKTPIAFSLKKGAEVLKALPGDKALILISDGEETCGGNPIKTAEQIKQELGIEVVIHVVGFDVNAKTRQQLLNIATVGGGKYYSADNAAQLKESLVKIKEEVVEKKPEPPPPPPPAPKPVVMKQLFADEFNGDKLSGEWVIMNDDPDARFLDKGVLTIVTSAGEMKNDAVKNIVLYDKELPEDYAVTLKFDKKESKTGWGVFYSVGIIFFTDKDNYLILFSQQYYDKLRMVFRKCAKGELVPDIYLDAKLFDPNEKYHFKVEKKKFKYTAYCEVQTEKGLEWKEVGTHTVIGKKMVPGIISMRTENVPEIAPEFDSFKIEVEEGGSK